MTGSAAHLWNLTRAALPTQSALFDGYRGAIGTPAERATLDRTYSAMLPADFSRDVLETVRRLEVVALRPCGWSDWGTPERVFASLRGTAEHQRLLRRLSRPVITAETGTDANRGHLRVA
jgi:hypothetical protein